ncbi:4-hydroxy-tetrahydrodipicolinate synthase, chloroplastic-like [Iris pallida]|uniref:4-hydroxy-tetrahydrodipicolinate synthase n=1 Tax=Iris pallida TaxID=29817 RepID=A0AAX6FY96_IRIPA|nr:4-hydroxy-tetrahydrodipicolinate synthase, chloroplastic-like [Iris pallida]
MSYSSLLLPSNNNGLCSRDPALALGFTRRDANTSFRVGKRISPQAAVISDVRIPMRSFEVKNRTSVDAIKSLRLITAVKTPYLPDGRFDLVAYDSLINMQIAAGVEGVIVGGTTGEGHLMSWDEHIMLIGHTVNCFGTSIKVIGNTGSNSTREAIHASEQGFAVGMHAALHINPYYGKTSMQGLVSHFSSVLPMGPTIIYNVPSRTGQDIPPPVIHSIAQDPNFAGIKECVGNERIKGYVDGGITIWSGNDDECHDSRWRYGATGVVSVTSNLVPGLMRTLMFRGVDSVLNSKLMPLIEWLFCEPNPIGLNTALAQLGVVRPIFRKPYSPLPLEKRVEFVNIVKAIGREHFVGEKDVRVLEDDEFICLDRY